MAYMSDEAYELMQDTNEKAKTARSAKSTRTHNGKSGCNFSHEKMTKKELESMNGEVKSYRMNSPMTWEEFKEMPNDLKVMYVKALRKKYNVPDKYISEMMGVDRATLCKLFSELGLSTGKSSGGKRSWDKEGFLAWCGGVKKDAVTPSETPEEEESVPEETVVNDEVVAVNDEPEIDIPEVENTPNPEEKEPEKKNLKEAVKKFADDCEAMPPSYLRHGGSYEIPRLVIPKCTIPSSGEMTFEGDVNDILRTISKTLEGAKVHLMVKWDVLDD